MFNRRYWSFARVPATVFLIFSILLKIDYDLYGVSKIFEGPRFYIIRLCEKILVLQLLSYFTGDILYCHAKNSRLVLWLNYLVWCLFVLGEHLELMFKLYF